jgi:lipopolysaccharide export system permease protein
VGFLLSLIVAVVYFFFIIIANSVRENPRWHPELLMWVPNVLCLGFGSWLFVRMSRR